MDDFFYGPITPVFAFVMAALGSALGLRCTVRALALDTGRRLGWLALGATAIGAGIFTMHFIAMMGFAVESVTIGFDLPLTYASLAVAITVCGIGVLLVGYAPHRGAALLGGGLITGLGVAAMHYLGMASMHLDAVLRYDTTVVALSVLVAVVAATVALWFAVAVRRFGSSVVASLVMAVAVCGMHYTGMRAVSVHAHAVEGAAGRAAVEVLLPALIVPVLLLVLIGLFVGLDPMTTQDIEQRIARARSAPDRSRPARPGAADGPRPPAGSAPRSTVGR